MNGVLSILIQLAIFGGLLATFLLPCFAAEYLTDLRAPWPILVGACSGGLTLFALYRWLLVIQRKERTVLSRTQHEFFGEVEQFKDHWEANAPVNDATKANIWGEALEPSEIQISTFAAITERYPTLFAQTLEQCNDFFRSLALPISADDLQLEGIYLPADEFGSFDLTFDVPAHVKQIPWGVTARFVNFVIDEISDNH